MRIGINTLVAIPDQIGGMQSYLRGLIGGLAEVDHHNEYVLYVAAWNREVFAPPAPNFRQVICPVPVAPLPARVAYEQAVLPQLAHQERLDVFHAPANVMPLLMPCPTVVTIHDVLVLRHPEATPAAFRHYWRVMLRLTAARAAHVITDSHASRADIIALLHCAPHKVQVIYPAPGLFERNPLEGQRPGDGSDDITALQPYILWVGKMYRHKNLPALLQAYALLQRETPSPHRLVLAGMDGWGAQEARHRIAALGLHDKVVLTGRVSDERLIALYQGADLFVFPSLYEGFGLPVVEAMSCGVPVITSNRGALAEVAADAALLVDPEDPQALSAAMRRVLADSGLRAELSAAGRRRSEAFSWQKTAQATLAVYQQARAQ